MYISNKCSVYWVLINGKAYSKSVFHKASTKKQIKHKNNTNTQITKLYKQNNININRNE